MPRNSIQKEAVFETLWCHVLSFAFSKAKWVSFFFLAISDSYLLPCPRYRRKSSCAHLIFSLVIYQIGRSKILWKFVYKNDVVGGILWEREGQREEGGVVWFCDLRQDDWGEAWHLSLPWHLDWFGGLMRRDRSWRNCLHARLFVLGLEVARSWEGNSSHCFCIDPLYCNGYSRPQCGEWGWFLKMLLEAQVKSLGGERSRQADA